MPQFPDARELDLALLFADLSGYTALTEIHGGLTASGIVLQFCDLARASLERGVNFINSIGDDVFSAGAGTLAVVRSALKLRDAAEGEAYFPRIRMGIHRGPVVERAGRLFGAPINLTARLPTGRGVARYSAAPPSRRHPGYWPESRSDLSATGNSGTSHTPWPYSIWRRPRPYVRRPPLTPYAGCRSTRNGPLP